MLTLLHTNDLHGHLDERGSLALASLKARHQPCLLLDSGDAVSCGNIGWHARGERMHELMNAAGYDAGALGNREFHFRPGPQRCKLSLARFPILCANLTEPAGYGGVRRSAILTPDGIPPVRLFGLLVPMVTDAMFARHLSPARFADPIASARALLAEPGPAVAICLSHLGERRDRELAAACPELPLILGGHSHTPLLEQLGETWLVQNEPHGAGLTRLSLSFDGERLSGVEAEHLPWPS